VLHSDWRTDRQTEGRKDIAKPIGAFCYSTDARSNQRSVAVEVRSNRLYSKTTPTAFLGLVHWMSLWYIRLGEGFSQRGDRARFRANLCGLYGGQIGTRTSSSLEDFGIPCNNYFTNPPNYLVFAAGFFSSLFGLSFWNLDKVFTSIALLAKTKLSCGCCILGSFGLLDVTFVLWRWAVLYTRFSQFFYSLRSSCIRISSSYSDSSGFGFVACFSGYIWGVHTELNGIDKVQ
jgi:hypothetical protein